MVFNMAFLWQIALRGKYFVPKPTCDKRRRRQARRRTEGAFGVNISCQIKPHFYPTHFDTKRTPLNQNIFTLGSRHFGTQTLRANARLRRFMQVGFGTKYLPLSAICHKNAILKTFHNQTKTHTYPTHFYM